jgi:ribosomal protein S18 acetylase RimI-like enzyme
MDVDLKHIVKTDSSLDRTEWEDRWFDMQTSELAPCTYVLENDSCIVGYLTVHTSRENHLQVTEVGVCKSQQGKGYGDTLIRFADTLARQSKCRAIRLQAIENKIGFYEKFGYTATAGATITTFGTESYLAMEKTLLYHTPYGNHSL